MGGHRPVGGDRPGNLTLLTGHLNASLSNRPWLDGDAAVAAPNGPEAGKGKRSLIDKYSLLVLNKEIVQEHQEAWTGRTSPLAAKQSPRTSRRSGPEDDSAGMELRRNHYVRSRKIISLPSRAKWSIGVVGAGQRTLAVA